MKKLISYSFILFALCLSTSLMAQITRTFHETYTLEDIETVHLELQGDVEILTWKGTSLMTETNVTLGNGSKGILNHLCKKGRYEIAVNDNEDGSITIASVSGERKAIITQTGSVDETVRIVVYVPEEFEARGKIMLVRVEETSVMGSNE